MCFSTAKANKPPPAPEEIALSAAIKAVPSEHRAALAYALEDYARAWKERHPRMARSVDAMAHLIAVGEWRRAWSTAGPMPVKPLEIPE
jgi:hypothetical protein